MRSGRSEREPCVPPLPSAPEADEIAREMAASTGTGTQGIPAAISRYLVHLWSGVQRQKAGLALWPISARAELSAAAIRSRSRRDCARWQPALSQRGHQHAGTGMHMQETLTAISSFPAADCSDGKHSLRSVQTKRKACFPSLQSAAGTDETARDNSQRAALKPRRAQQKCRISTSCGLLFEAFVVTSLAAGRQRRIQIVVSSRLADGWRCFSSLAAARLVAYSVCAAFFAARFSRIASSNS